MRRGGHGHGHHHLGIITRIGTEILKFHNHRRQHNRKHSLSPSFSKKMSSGRLKLNKATPQP